jgi:hypothetical protein
MDALGRRFRAVALVLGFVITILLTSAFQCGCGGSQTCPTCNLDTTKLYIVQVGAGGGQFLYSPNESGCITVSACSCSDVHITCATC